MSKQNNPGGNSNNEPVLTAVVVADSFNKRFSPLTAEKPRCLLPLANVPLIEYTMECLAVSGVQEILIVCCAHSSQLKTYFKNSKWHKCALPKVTLIISKALQSVGDALRELDGKQILQSDFILVSGGDVISNVNLQEALAVHRARRLTDKNSIMTMLMRQATPAHRTRSKGEEGLFVLDAATQECVSYRSIYPPSPKLKIETASFKTHPEIQIRNDLIDCQIDICSLDVPALFTENFDYQDIRRDFVKGVLDNFELLGKTIYCHILTSDYAARVRSTHMYDAISKDMISRWVYPVVPDLMQGEQYSFSPMNHVYKGTDVVLSRSSILDSHVVVGKGTTVGENTRIKGSVIGRNCRIGNNVCIEGSYIWDGVIIGDGCHITRSILANDVVLKDKVIVSKGSILSFGVVIGAGFHVKEFSRLSRKKRTVTSRSDDSDEEDEDVNSESDDDSETAAYSEEHVGVDGEGFIWEDNDSDDEEEEDYTQKLQLCSLARDIAPLVHEDTLDEDSDSSEAGDESDRVLREIYETWERAVEENHTIDNLCLELNTLKFAYNLDFHDLRQESIKFIIGMIVSKGSSVTTLKDVLKRWGSALSKFVMDMKDQFDLLIILESQCSSDEAMGKLFLPILQMLYQDDIVEEDAVLAWYPKSSGKVRDSATPFVKWLQEADEESDESDSD